MLMDGQTLQHKETGVLVQLVPVATGLAWHIGKETPFYNEAGEKFTDDIANYTHISNEFGLPVCGCSPKGPDLSLKKYIGVDLTSMRENSLSKLEKELLAKMAISNYIIHPFANYVFRKYFLKNRDVRSLYREWREDGWHDGLQVFNYNGQLWASDNGHLFVIEVL